MIKYAFSGNQRDMKTDERIDYRVFLHPERPADRAAQEAQVSGHYHSGHLCGIEWRGRVGSDLKNRGTPSWSG
jgi:hypothetical protein